MRQRIMNLLSNPILIITIMLSLSCSARVGQPVAIGITEIGTCGGYDEENGTPIDIKDTFSTDDERIVLYFYLKTNIDVTLGYRWFHEGKLVYSHQASKNAEGYNFGWLSTKKGKKFPVGSYRVEVVLGNSVLRATEFYVRE
jgi:hypothetical protein